MFRQFLLLVTLAIVPLSAQPKISQSKLDALTRKWQHVLKLDDWDIRTKLASADELPDQAWGASGTETERRVMHILVLNPKDYAQVAAQNGVPPKVGREITRDIEDTIVHELVHLRLK